MQTCDGILSHRARVKEEGEEEVEEDIPPPRRRVFYDKSSGQPPIYVWYSPSVKLLRIYFVDPRVPFTQQDPRGISFPFQGFGTSFDCNPDGRLEGIEVNESNLRPAGAGAGADPIGGWLEPPWLHVSISFNPELDWAEISFSVDDGAAAAASKWVPTEHPEVCLLVQGEEGKAGGRLVRMGMLKASQLLTDFCRR